MVVVKKKRRKAKKFLIDCKSVRVVSSVAEMNQEAGSLSSSEELELLLQGSCTGSTLSAGSERWR